MAKITINGKKVEVPEGTNVLEAAVTNGIPLEHFCYHRYLPVAGNCRTCMVEIEGPKGNQLAIGCNTHAAEGMVIHTDTPRAQEAQRTALEMLLLDHPLDCPVCDKAGECRLQDQYMQYGLYDFRRGVERYFKGGKAEDIGEHVVLDQERCVLCTRCIRFVDEVPKTSELGIIHRGHEAKLTIFPGIRLDNPYSGNVADVCPVGALTLKEFRFKQRVWLLKKTPSICPGCARGCNITAEHNQGRIYRFMPRENAGLNKAWICDEGRFSFKHYQENRLMEIRLGHKNTSLKEGIGQLAALLAGISKEEIAGIASPYATLEDQYALLKLFEKKFNPKNLRASSGPSKGTFDSILRLPEKYPNEAGLKLLGIPKEDEKFNTRMEKGEFKAVLLLHPDSQGRDVEESLKKYKKVKVLVVLSTHQTPLAQQAAMAFPILPFTERAGTYVNATWRLQKFQAALDSPHPDVVEACVWVYRLGLALEAPGMDLEDTQSIFNDMALGAEALRGMTFSSIPGVGKILAFKTSAPEPFQSADTCSRPAVKEKA